MLISLWVSTDHVMHMPMVDRVEATAKCLYASPLVPLPIQLCHSSGSRAARSNALGTVVKVLKELPAVGRGASRPGVDPSARSGTGPCSNS